MKSVFKKAIYTLKLCLQLLLEVFKNGIDVKQRKPEEGEKE